MSNYTKTTNFASKDNLSPGNPLKIVKGTEIDTEYNNIATAIATKTDNASAAITGGSITGITDLAIADGGTGASTANAALNNLLPSQASASGKYLKSNGTDASWDQLDISTADITGTLPVANGGTGVTTSTGTGSVVLSNSPTLVTPALGIPSSGTATNLTGLPISTGVSGLGTGVATFLGTPSSANLASAVTDETGSGALVFANSPTLVTPTLGTPASATLTNATGLPISTGVSGLGTGVATFLATPSSANLASAVSDETGSGALVFANSPTLVTPALGTPSSGTLTNATGLPISTGVSGLGTGVATALAVNVGSAGAPVVNGGALGTPSSGTATNLTGLPLSTGVTGTLPVANGGTGQTTANAAFNALAPSQTSNSGKYLTTDGTNTSWATVASGSGDVVGPSSATDNALARFDTTTGKLLQNSVGILSDSGALSGLTDISASGSVTLSGGTANGVTYLNGSKVLTSGSALTFDGTNLSNSGNYVSSAAMGRFAKSNITGRNLITGGTTGGTTDGAYIITEGYDYGGTAAGGAINLVTAGASSPITFLINGSEVGRFTSTGLGIGTSSPAAKLDVVGNAYVSGKIALGGTTITDNNLLNIQGSNAVNNIGIVLNKTNGTAQIWGVQNSGPLVFFDYTASAERMRLDTSGNLGLGVTPSAWDSAFKAFQLNTTGALASTSNRTFVGQNWYDSASGGKHIANGYALRYDQIGANGSHAWYTSTSGTAGNAISFTQAMTLDASGNLGVGTTSPNFKLHVSAGSTTSITQPTAGTYGLYVQQNTSGSTGGIYIQDGASNSGNSLFIADNNGAGRLVVDGDGNLLVGTTNSSITAGIGLKANYDSAAPYYATVGSSTSSGAAAYSLYSTGSAAYKFYVNYAGTVNATSTTITAISDQRLKENIRDLDEGLLTVMALKPRKFDWKEGKGQNIKNARGFIAQEFETVLPDMIEEWKDPAPEGEEAYKAINANLIPTLVKAIQELKAEFDAYKSTHP